MWPFRKKTDEEIAEDTKLRREEKDRKEAERKAKKEAKEAKRREKEAREEEVNKKEQRERFLEYFGYLNIIIPLENALEVKGYRFTHKSPYTSGNGYMARIIIDDTNLNKQAGVIIITTPPGGADNYLWCLHSLRMLNMGDENAKNDLSIRGDSKNLIGFSYFQAIEIEKTGVLMVSATPTTDIPEWLMIAARIYKESGIPLANPKWYYEKEQNKRFLNVMFN